MLLIDTSGSMNDSDGTGRIKMDGARRALIDFVRGVPQGTLLGLRTYPGGSESDANGCSKGALPVSLSQPDLSEVDAVIRHLAADGDTPTAAALEQAGEDVRGTGATEGTVVLVSDGLSNCGPDPCEVARGLAATGLAVTVNTVGFRISDEGRAQLECIAATTNGLYTDVDNNAELVDQLNELSKPILDTRLDVPGEVKAAVGQDASGQVAVVAHVTAIGASPVVDAQVTLAFAGAVRPAVINPRHRIGTLAPGATREVTWTFRPPFEARDSTTLRVVVTTRADNSPAFTTQASIKLDTRIVLDDAGRILSDAHAVAILGDSYSAGEGAGGYDKGTNTFDNACHRSRRTYAVSLWERRDDPGDSVDIWACSGATTSDIDFANAGNDGEPAQVSRLNRKAYDLVLMTIGGNDIGFSSIVKFCLLTPRCSERSLDDVFDTGAAAVTFGELVLRNVRALRPVLVDTYRSVELSLNLAKHLKARGRPAPLVVLGYPTPMPLMSRPTACSFAFGAAERRFFQTLVEELNTTAAAAVAELADEGLPVYFASDVMDAFQPDHTYCGHPPYLNRLSTKKTVRSITGKVDDLAQRTIKWLAPTVGFARQKIREAVVSDAERARVLNEMNEQVHPTADGYRAMTVELVRWSTTEAARRPVTRRSNGLEVIAAPPTKTLHLTNGSTTGTLTVEPGSVLELRVTGLPPQSPAEVWVQSDPTILGRMTSDEVGSAVLRFRIPTGTAIGAHRLVVTSADSDDTGAAVTTVRLLVSRHRAWWAWALLPLGLAGSAIGERTRRGARRPHDVDRTRTNRRRRRGVL
jgi:lysophospholipase L1-like esterase